jgi:hypothetical protein
MPQHDWERPTAQDELFKIKAQRDQRQADKLVKRAAKNKIIGDGVPLNIQNDPDFEDEPETDLMKRMVCRGYEGRTCGRHEVPWMMDDIRTLPVEIRGDRDFMCYACRETLFVLDIIDRYTWMEYMGAPAEQIAAFEAHHELNPSGTGKRKKPKNPK